ncbi:hypothetical protein MBAV_001185 [Candidatus Magnetobacterium bavaricum]|uniref:Uncharacterized protein n=1 Tax=Candidatus Magnetobacterium bavaricum TaxID=29290 RepID=A0A0F3GXN1_9BACT|nr:hypothetical protein MBAV_001185 [Candidatus Magnetobacterium bavaricum]
MRIFYNHLVGFRIFEYFPCRLLPILQVSRHTGPGAKRLCRGINTHKYYVRLFYAFMYVRTKKKVPVAGFLDNLIQTGFVQRKVVRVPTGDLGSVNVNDGDFILRALVCYHSHRRATYITGSYAKDISCKSHGFYLLIVILMMKTLTIA